MLLSYSWIQNEKNIRRTASIIAAHLTSPYDKFRYSIYGPNCSMLRTGGVRSCNQAKMALFNSEPCSKIIRSSDCMQDLTSFVLLVLLGTLTACGAARWQDEDDSHSRSTIGQDTTKPDSSSGPVISPSALPGLIGTTSKPLHWTTWQATP